MALEGNLQDLSLIELIQLFRIGVKTGVLWLIGGTEQGAVYVRAGCLIDAVLTRGPERQVIATADDAVIYLLQWEEARFTFQPDSKINRRPVRMIHDHEWLIQEAARRREHAVQARPEQAISLDTRFALSRQPGTTGAFRLDLDQWRILSLVAICPSARALSARSGLTPNQALAGLTQLLVIGLIEVM
jgi:hypothetical protein